MLLDLLIAGLATSQIVEIWLEGTIFSTLQASFKRTRDHPAERWVWRKLADLLTCFFCLMPWVGLGVMTVLLTFEQSSYQRLPVYMFAVARVAHLINDVRARISTPEVIDQTREVDSLMLVDPVDDPEDT